MRLNHNMASLTICREQEKVWGSRSMYMNRISSGFKINSAKENPNGLALSEKMRVQIRGLQIAQRNAQDGMSMLQSADGALEGVQSMLIRVRELTIQAGGATSENDRKALQSEINQMVDGINDTLKYSDFNEKSILSAEPGKTHEKMAIGANVGEVVDIPVYHLSSAELKLDSIKKDNLNTDDIGQYLQVIDSAVDRISDIRGKYGALCNRFEGTYNEVNEMHDTIVGTESKIRDTDIAEAMMNLARDNILVEAGQAMLVQSNKLPQDALRVLEGVK
ncbi:flagellin [Clostridium botulinum]|uniref:flagellin N-terminal helical domain-containing protein n=1 Tax=Clostridium botulinum TaxID=1491 RepID=UPI00052E17BD|nr:flagellin [Clostridium botulinum]KGM96550.1 flagellin [Clostridium botulinum D str. CCUG 7971]KOC48484.1 flagellin [Clostridium botulinum]NFO98712.1 flagellin [Clostridium botulinum]OOV50619.1 flagellin [Clostridium botulinum D/C]OOV55461.1 flagellin [Clostridium botulinum D/C]